MVTSISSVSLAPASPGAAAASASVALQDKLARCEQQLGDWQACPSRKTPEGKKIIQDLQTQIRNLESRIGNSGNTQASPQSGARAGSGGSVTLGRTVDVFA